MQTVIAPSSQAPATLRRLALAVNAPLVQALRHPWVESIVRLSAVEEALTSIHPLLSLTNVRARVVRIVDETPTTKTFVLQPNALWAGAQAGQFVRVQLEINGRRVERAYSLSSRPGWRRIAFTVKRQEPGLVSGHLHAAVKVGDVLTISQALGEFVLPNVLPTKMLLLSAGSGITPVMSMLRDLKARQYQGDLVFLHVCRAPDDLIFAQQLYALAADFSGLRLVVHHDTQAGFFSPQVLAAQVPDLGARSTWMCGPAGFMDAMSAYWVEQGFESELFSERFVGAPVLPSTAPGKPVAVSFVKSGATFTTHGTDPLLVQAERAGLTPKHGCRIGICRSCQCVKTSGTVENLQTGEVSSAPNELIRLCISTARSDVALAL
nr:ferredoxin reductase [uncultured Rhodoferax sp.]